MKNIADEIRASKNRQKKATMRPDENGPVVHENIAQEAAAARSGQEDSVAVIGDSIAPVS